MTLDGKPVGPGTILFTPVEGGRPASCTVRDDGTFDVSYREPGDGLPPGNYKAVITVEKTVDKFTGKEIKDPTLGDMSRAKPVSIVPKEYSDLETSPYTLEVKEGQKEIIIDIKTK